MNNLEIPYEIVLYWVDEEQRYVAEVPELPGCRASGKTRVDAIFHIENAIEVWVDTAKLSGDPVPQPQGRCSFR